MPFPFGFRNAPPTPEGAAAQDEESGERPSKPAEPGPVQLLGDASYLCVFSGLLLYGLFVIGLGTSIVPVRLSDPRWQQGVINLLISYSYFPLLGGCLVLLGLYLDPENELALGSLRRFRKRAWIACIGYLLLIPSQLLLTIRQDIDLRTPLLKEQSDLRAIRQEVKLSNSLPELAKALTRLPGSPQLPKAFNGPFQPFRADVEKVLNTNAKRLDAEITRRTKRSRTNALINLVRVLLSCGFISLVFAAFARKDFSRPSILQRYL